ncbi:rRNA maturation RNase YbeY [Roseospirillum parvum]|uniref:Endoribonuclease YbeY n=1 Tax=Roseospirillum parvum TaxID=83401 RepID=A0A1G8DMM6_9PROT|nr:rRNA maturation RNase YbeY [Roseospirillum parvum]SDH58749.1 probable rRNA maturation factor [Roseospirillum parvum]
MTADPAVAATEPRLDLDVAMAVSIDEPEWLGALPEAEALVQAATLAALRVGLADRAQHLEDGALEDGAGEPITGALEVSVVLTDERTVWELNRAHRGQDKPTNVLSFATLDDPEAPEPVEGQPLLLGDVVLSYDTCADEAEAAGKPLADHLAHLVIHGVLHLLGHDHLEDDEAAEMEALESRAMATLGRPDPYADSDPVPLTKRP